MSTEARSPLKDKPLRAPGQSLQEEWRALVDDKLEPWFLLAVFLVALALLEWFRYYRNDPPQPEFMSAVAAAMVVAAAWRYFRLRPKLRQLRLGAEGERAVGQFLERLRVQGYQVFHDVLGDGFNVDHICIGPAGAFTIETKTWRKPRQGRPQIQYDGEHLTVGGCEPERDVLGQARAQAKWLARTLEESTGRKVPVRPVIVFPGWFVQATAGAQAEVWVMEPKGLPAFLNNEPTRLSAEETRMAAFHLSRLVRLGERVRDSAN